MSQIGLSTNEYPASEGFAEAIPAGTALVMMTKSELKATASGNGSRLLMHFNILDGEHKGSKLFVAENWVNASEESTRIGRGRVSSISHAVGKPQGVNMSEELHDKPFILQWSLEEAQGAYHAKNNIVVARPASGDTANAGVDIPKETGAAQHNATTETSNKWDPATTEPQFNAEEISESATPPGVATPPSTATPPGAEAATFAETLPNEHPTLVKPPVQNPVTGKWECKDSATGETYSYEADGLYHLVPAAKTQPGWGAKK